MNAGPPARMRVLLLCDQLDVRGGVERFVCVLANHLDAQGFEVAVGTVDTGTSQVRYPLNPGIQVLAGRERSPSRHAEPSAGTRLGRLWGMLVVQWRTSRALRGVLHRHRPDVVLFNGLATACVVLAVDRRWSARAVCCDHNHFNARSRPWQSLRARLYPGVAEVVSLTEADAPKFRALNPRTRVIHNTSSLRAERPALPAAPLALAVARLVAQKGIDLLLHAWVQVVAVLPAARLRVVGDGPLRESLVQLAETLKIASSVEWLGEIQDLEACYREAAVFVLASRFEGMPLVLLEAQAMGVPAVVFDCPTGPAEIITPETGVLAPPEDVGALARGLLLLLGQPAVRERMAWAALRRSNTVFSPAHQLAQWVSVIHDVRTGAREQA